MLPPDFNTGGLGTGAVFSLAPSRATCARPQDPACLVSEVAAQGGVFIVQVAPTRRAERALAALSRGYGSQINLPRPPTDLVNFGQSVNFPLIFGLIVVVFGVGTLLHLLLTSLGRRRREMGLLKSLGFVRRQVALSVSWQTTTVASSASSSGSRWASPRAGCVERAFADNLGVGTQPVVTASEIALLAVGTLVVANLLAVLPALPGRHGQSRRTMLREE